jgi:GxxExxY protein
LIEAGKSVWNHDMHDGSTTDEKQEERKRELQEALHPVYLAYLVVDCRVIIVVKAVSVLSSSHTAQLVNYLPISGLRLGFLFNFAQLKLEFRRPVV